MNPETILTNLLSVPAAERERRMEVNFIAPVVRSGAFEDIPPLIEAARSLLGAQWAEEAEADAFARIVESAVRGATGQSRIILSEFLVSKNMPEADAVRAASLFGKYARRAYVESRGHDPEQEPVELDNGHTVPVNVYTEDDRDVLDAAFATFLTDQRSARRW